MASFEPTVRSVEEPIRVAHARIAPHVTDTGRYLRDHLASGGTLLGEGAHGAFIRADHRGLQDVHRRPHARLRRPA